MQKGSQSCEGSNIRFRQARQTKAGEEQARHSFVNTGLRMNVSLPNRESEITALALFNI
jgi:hypothetical protein